MKFLKRFGKSFSTRAGTFVFFSLAATAFFCLLSAKWAYGWIAELYPLGENFIPTLFVLISICGAVTFSAMFLVKALKANRALRIVHAVFAVLTGALFVYTIVLLFGFDKGIDPGALRQGAATLAPNLPFIGVAVGLPFAFLIFPKLKKTARVVTAILVSIAVVVPLLAIYAFVPKIPFALSANPLVLDIGGDNYSVVFATNRTSTGYLTYEYEGETVTLADASHGRMDTARIHQFTVPRAHLNGNSYSVAAREVISAADLGAEYGEAIKSETYQFKGDYKDALNILIASDWHDNPANLLAAAANFPEPDLFLMLGDHASNYNSEDELILHTIAAGADATKSVIPAVFVRGNHEMGGNIADIVFDNLGLDRFYYQVERGNYVITVADSAVDHEPDRTESKGFPDFPVGSVNSECGAYRDEQLDWLEALPARAEGTFHISAVHIPGYDPTDKTRQERFWNTMQRLGADIQVSGHHHRLRLLLPDGREPEYAASLPRGSEESDRERYALSYPLLIDGGPKDGGYSGTYVCSMAQVSADGTVQITSYDSLNEKLLNETLALAF